ncbi:MAG TPA: CpXC domain-containing protein [Caldimonas sp.]
MNADRRPDFRDAILDGSFQRQPCPGCATPFRVEPEFTDMKRGQYIGVWPTARRADWQACGEKTRAVFDDALGRNAPPEARRIGEDLDVRVVFGWPALVEKILARGAGIDDRTLEVAKLAVAGQQRGDAAARPPRAAPGAGGRRLDAVRLGRCRRRATAFLARAAPADRRHRSQARGLEGNARHRCLR